MFCGIDRIEAGVDGVLLRVKVSVTMLFCLLECVQEDTDSGGVLRFDQRDELS